MRLLLYGVVFLQVGCASYYQRNYSFNKEFESGNLERALQTLQDKDQAENSRSKFLYYANNGLVLSIMGKYTESNEFFEKAFLFGEDYAVNYVNEALSYWTNPRVTVYRGEDHEHLMVLYFKAMNYLKMGDHEAALVECRRLNIRLQQLSDKYSSEKKYRRDAFVHNLMGIIYQAGGDFNNAFIAYRNSLEAYEEDYLRLFGVPAPEQLKKDLLNTAYWAGLIVEYEELRIRLGMESYVPGKPQTNLVFFWHNGLAPVKEEWSINFAIRRGPENDVVFVNDAMGLRFPFRVDEDQRNRLSRLEFYRVAFPRYANRSPYYRSANIRYDSVHYPLELSEDIGKIAVHCLQERMLLEFSKGLLRAALKKATEHSIRKEDEALGAVIGAVNALTEHADTRNWQTLPGQIAYARVPLTEGENNVSFSIGAGLQGGETYSYTYQAKEGQTLFHTFSSLESEGINRGY